MHGTHQVAQKSTTTILPRNFSRLMGVPSTAWKERTGFSPTLTIAKLAGAMQRMIASAMRSCFMALLDVKREMFLQRAYIFALIDAMRTATVLNYFSASSLSA